MSVTSLGSNMSNMSISFRGDDEADVGESLDLIFREIQGLINNTQCKCREMCQIEERNETYMEACNIHYDIEDFIDGLNGLFIELKGVGKQILGPCPKEYKDEYKTFLDNRKQLKMREKQEKKESKKCKMSDIAE